MRKILVLAAAAALAGCGSLDRADPSARSARTTYGAITVTATDNSTCTVTLGDGALAAADGDGGISQPSTMTTTQNPSLTMPGDLVTAGISGITSLVGKGIDAYAARGTSAAKTSTVTAECPDGNCTIECANGECQDGGCTDGNREVK